MSVGVYAAATDQGRAGVRGEYEGELERKVVSGMGDEERVQCVRL